ncbi:MAG: HEAT repeat domain-containing protein [Myxococcales bacterium FL481]|nr:MAG: HEAT repeat domain-containing protein [Myxococcales bacterium FL481]
MIDTAAYWVRAEGAMRGRRYEEALGQLRRLIQVVDRIDFEYEEWLRSLHECLRTLGLDAQAATCAAYLGATQSPPGGVFEHLVEAARAGDPAAARSLRLRAIYLSRAGLHDVAARWFAAAGMSIQQTIELERAGRHADAAAMWQRLIDGGRLGERPYELALAKINLALCRLRMDRPEARAALLEATTAIEQVADRFEGEGLRERSFDCYQLLARLGVETGAFENVAEGYVNSIRILKDDGLRLDALRLYEAFVVLARRAGEHHAVATILREAAEYCWRNGLPYGDDLCWRSADAWVKAGEEALVARYPQQMVESAFIAAASGYGAVRAFSSVAEVYRRLLLLDPQGRSAAKYRRLLARLGQQPADAPKPVPVPEFLKQVPDYEEVWYVDLAEWELDGDPACVAAGIMADRRFPDFIRRHALLLVLGIEEASAGDPPALQEIVTRLRSIRAYPVISVLEHMYHRGDAELRAVVAEALGSLRFKRSFGLLGQAVRSDDASVREAATRALGGLFFPHAFDPLRKLFDARDLRHDQPLREAVLSAIGRINSIDALEFLCERLREGQEPFADMAADAIARLSNAELVPYLKQQVELVPAAHRPTLEDVAQRLVQNAS